MRCRRRVVDFIFLLIPWSFFFFTLVPAQQDSLNRLTVNEKKAGWVLLFDGKTAEGWRGMHQSAFPQSGWTVRNSALTVLSADSVKQRGGDIITIGQYGCFELCLEFRLTPGANSGIKYFIVDSPDSPGRSGVGPEFQILDDALHPDAKLGIDGNRTCGSLYDLIPAGHKTVKPVGEWNAARILSKGSHVEHWLNGVKVLEYERGGGAFQAAVARSKFKGMTGFAAAPKGHILLQDHGNEVAFRNVKIREFPTKSD